MARVEKTVFISYRRKDVYTALAVYESLKNQGFDVFFDYRSISSGDFEQVITSNIKARAHFILILTPTALDRCNEPGDWLRLEIETAIDEKRNIVPLFFRGFRFDTSSKSGISKWLRLGRAEVLTGKLKNLSRYNGLNVHEDYFEEAMNRLRTEYLSKPLDTVIHPVSTEISKVVEEEQKAADEALRQREVVKESVKHAEEKPVKSKVEPTQDPLLKTLIKTMRNKFNFSKSLSDWKSITSGLDLRRTIGVVGGILLVGLSFWGISSVQNNLLETEPDPTRTLQPTVTQTLHPTSTRTSKPTTTHTSPPVKTNTPSTTPTPEPDINDPQGEPVSVWKDIPIMPQAINGYELVDRNSYSFTVKATPVEIATYYHEKLTRAGWTTRAGWFIYSEKEGLGTYRNGELRLDFTISAHGDLSLVELSFSFNIE